MISFKITGIYDNRAVESLIPGWGLSLVIENSNSRILFDTGADLKILSNNLNEIGIDPESFNAVVLSHPHCDHTGGLSTVLRKNSDLRVYMTESFPESLKSSVEDHGARLDSTLDPVEPTEGVITTGEMITDCNGTDLPEQGLILRTKRGPLLICGCAHPGVVKMVKRTKGITGDFPYLAIGGFHLSGKTKKEIEAVVNGLIDNNVDSIAPTHCTGEKATEMFKKSFGGNFFELEAGRQIDLSNCLDK
ncbi:MBL fold metallo-hydrolase [Candidatus Bipolaricaulota bacterium]|nr:MBL fold metallo-hydrolase [Candidatus Bipolaricaulota bacterium]